jgi:hypothetical protein
MNTVASKPGTIRIRKPTAAPRASQAAPTFRVDRPLKGLRVGLRTDPTWLSWTLIADIWAGYLKKDGAEPVVFPIVEHIGEVGEKSIAELKQWANTLDCAVVGIGT